MPDLFEVEPTTTTSLDVRRMARQERRKECRTKSLIVMSVGLVLFGLAASVSWNFVQSFRANDLVVADYEGVGQGSVRVVVEPGDSGEQIGQALFEAGVVASVEAFRLETFANDELARSIAPGYYRLQREMKAEFALIALTDSSNREVTRISIPEGYSLERIIERVAALIESDETEVRAALENPEALGLPDEANGLYEGWLFPATYEFNPDVSPDVVFSSMIQETISRLEANGVERSQWLRVLTIASLIEKEAKLDEDRPMVSGVIANRLEAGRALEFDSTVHYIFREEGNLFTTADQRSSTDPYNTYRYTGLPPGPITAPGEESIKAAVSPTSHDFLFFVTVNPLSGETLYAKTFNQHLSNVEVLREWLANNDT